MGDYCVIAGGWSARGTDWARLPGTTIGVNDAGIKAGTDVIVTMDRLWSEKRWTQLLARKRPTYIRRAATKNLPPAELREHWVCVFDCDHTDNRMVPNQDVRLEEYRLNGTNSGFCALNLAYQLAPPKSRVLLIGFDMCRGPSGEIYWHEPYEWAPQGATSSGKYKQWAGEFALAGRAFKEKKIDVVNCSLPSAIQVWPRRPVEDFYV